MAKRLTTEQFVDKLKSLYGDKYDYSLVDYVNTITPVVLICKRHGRFTKSPATLLRGYGCNDCSKEQRYSEETAEARKEDYRRRTEKRKQTCLAKYGVDNPMHLEASKQALRETCRKKYGVDNPRQLQSVIDKARSTNMDRYGAISYAKSPEGLAHIQRSMKAHYGVDNFMKSDAHLEVAAEMLEKSKQTQLRRYGAEHYSQSDEAKAMQSVRKEKEYRTKALNDSWNTSLKENMLFDLLIDKFGRDDVIKQYKSDLYPFLCDFYIKSRDLYIELNASWTHGGCWFTENNKMLSQWQEKAIESEYYKNAIKAWTEYDVNKRHCAEKNNLNYIVFWDSELRDAELWFAMDCPDGQDWRMEYSWLGKRVLNPCFNVEFTGSSQSASMVAKKYQWQVFYENELRLWNDNTMCYSKLPLQVYLYYNRWKYLKKLPNELSDFELLRAFKISGVYRSYSVFDISLMNHIIDKYDIKSVYDPFAGWGERLLCCYRKNIQYLGVDVNFKLFTGYDQMINDYDMREQCVLEADARYYTNINASAVITCPPYFNTEIYSKNGLEVLSYDDFLSGFKRVVQNCYDANVELFCFQINQRYKSDMTDVVVSCGYDFVEELTFDKSKVSHFHKVRGKKEYESMLVFSKRNT